MKLYEMWLWRVYITRQIEANASSLCCKYRNYKPSRGKGGINLSGQNETISLTVEKSIPSDVGHGRARISGDSGLDLKPGDIVLDMTGKSEGAISQDVNQHGN